MNGQPIGNIIPESGLRQGDLSSLFIFILCTQVLVNLLNNGIRVSRASPLISHLHFANGHFLL